GPQQPVDRALVQAAGRGELPQHHALGAGLAEYVQQHQGPVDAARGAPVDAGGGGLLSVGGGRLLGVGGGWLLDAADGPLIVPAHGAARHGRGTRLRHRTPVRWGYGHDAPSFSSGSWGTDRRGRAVGPCRRDRSGSGRQAVSSGGRPSGRVVRAGRGRVVGARSPGPSQRGERPCRAHRAGPTLVTKHKTRISLYKTCGCVPSPHSPGGSPAWPSNASTSTSPAPAATS